MRHRAFLRPTLWLVVGLLLLGVATFPAHASNILDNVGNTYKTTAGNWEASLLVMAKRLFLKLALIEMLWFGIWWIIERDDPRNFLVSMLRKIMGLLFFWAILVNFDTWIPAIISGFTTAGETAASTGALTPSTVLDRGLEIATKITSTSNSIGLLDGAAGIGKYLLAGLSALGILLAFGVIAGQMLVTLIESYIVVNAGVLFLGFAGSRWTTTFAEKYLSYSFSVGVKLFMTYLIVGAGASLSDGWAATITSNMQVADYLTILVGSLVYMFLAWQIPSLAGSMLSGAPSMTLGAAVATAGTVAAGALGAAGAAAAAAGGAVNSVAGAAKAGSAAINQAKEKSGGNTSIGAMMSGTVGALAGGMKEAAGDKIKGLGAGSSGGSLAGRIDNKTASIRESNAAGSVSSPSVAGGQPPAPAAPAGSTPPAPAAAAGSAPGAAGGRVEPSLESSLSKPAESGGAAPAASAASGDKASAAASSGKGGDAAGSASGGKAAAPTAAAAASGGRVEPSLGEASTATRPTPPAPSSEGAKPAKPAAPPTSSIIDTSGNVGAALASREAQRSGSAPAASAQAPAAAPAAPAAGGDSAPASGGTDTASAAGGEASTTPAPASPPSEANAPSGEKPNNGDDDKEKKTIFETLAGHAEAITKTPNDSAGGAGVQINLKHSE